MYTDKYTVWMRDSDGDEDIQTYDNRTAAIKHARTNNRILKWGGGKVKGNARNGWSVTMPGGNEIKVTIYAE